MIRPALRAYRSTPGLEARIVAQAASSFGTPQLAGGPPHAPGTDLDLGRAGHPQVPEPVGVLRRSGRRAPHEPAVLGVEVGHAGRPRLPAATARHGQHQRLAGAAAGASGRAAVGPHPEPVAPRQQPAAGRSRAHASRLAGWTAWLAWSCGCSPSPSRGRRTTTCCGWPRRPRSWASGRSSGPTTSSGWAPTDCPARRDAWVTLGALARETSTIRLGTLVTSVTFRWPGLLAVQVAQVDQMSGGRVELGIGAGWFDREHAAYAVPFPDTRRALRRCSRSRSRS